MDRIAHMLRSLYFRIRFLRQIAWAIVVLALGLIIYMVVPFGRDQVVTQPVGWENRFNITPAGYTVRSMRSTSRGNFIAVVFDGTFRGKSGVFVAISFNGGSSFLEPVTIAEVSARIEVLSDIAVSSSGQVTVVWHNMSENEATNRLYLARSMDLGATWKAVEKLSLGSEMEMLPRIFYDNYDRLHLFYHGLRSGYFNLFHAIEENGFRIIGSIITLSADMKGAFFPSIHMAGNNVFMVWQGKKSNYSDDLFYIRSTNYGETWFPPIAITRSKGNASPAVILHKGVLYVAYRNNDGGNWSIKLIKAKDNGEEWDALPVTVSNTNSDCFAPALAASGGHLIITWYDLRERVGQIYSRQYVIESREFQDEVNVSLSTVHAQNPSLIPSRDRVLLVWEEGNRILGKNTDVYVPAPVVYSITHPEGTWSKNPVAEIRWKQPADESGITGYAVMITKPSDPVQMREANPSIQNMAGAIDRRTISELDDGITYFHIRAIDGAGNWSRTVHYRIQTSINPLPVPVLISPTHPEPGKAGTSSTTAEFRWALEGRDRLKGFVYSLSRGSAKRPETFTRDFSITFPDLAEGNYFFTLAAVDKANQLGRYAQHYFIMGRAEQIDPNRLIELARIHDEEKRAARAVSVPSVELELPFDPSKPFARDTFSAVLRAKNIPESRVEGFAVYIAREKKAFPERINQRSSIITIEGLKSGMYTMGVRCRYYQMEAGRKVFRWTEPAEKIITINRTPDESPLSRYAFLVREKLSRRILPAMILLGIMSAVALFMGWGTRILFRGQLLVYRLRLFMLMFTEK